MKISNKILVLSGIVLLGLWSCTEEEKLPYPYDRGPANGIHGAYLKTLEVVDSEINQSDIAGSNFAVNLEYNDSNKGKNLQDIEVYLAFTDNSIEDGGADISVAEISTPYETIMPSGLSTDDKPVLNYVDAATDALAFLGIDGADLGAGDEVVYRFKVNLTDGQSFSAGNTNSNIISETAYQSRFIYSASVFCFTDLPDASLFDGPYTVDTDAWADYAEGDIVQAEFVSGYTFRLPNTTRPFIVNGGSTYLEVTFDPADGSATVTSNMDWDYGGGFTTPVTGVGTVGTCNGAITLDLTFGANGTFAFNLVK